MRHRNLALRFSSLAAALALGACAQGDGGSTGQPAPFQEPIRIIDKDSTALQGELAEAAQSYLADQYGLIGGLSGGDEFVVLSKKDGQSGDRHVRMSQSYEGIKVFGADIVIHAQGNSFHSLNGTVVKALDGFDTSTKLDEADAMAIAKNDYKSLAKAGVAGLDQLAFDRESTELVILPLEQRDAVLAYHVVFFTELQAEINPGLWNYFVDARTGEIVQKFNAIHTLSQASGPGGNAKAPRTWTDELDVEPSGAQFKMDTARLITVNMNNSQSGSGTVVTGPLNPIGDAPINDAHGYAEATLNFMQEWYGYNSINDAGFKIRSRVHYGSNYENAFWDGSQMTYGDGASTFYPLSGDEDVVSHEINHGFTTFHSNLTYSAMSGGMNESFSDIAGVIISYYLNGNAGDFLIGAKIFKNPSPTAALRYACNPTQDGNSIDHASQYSGQDVHYTSGVFNKAFCLTSRRLSGVDPTNGSPTAAGVRRAGEAWYKANDDFWTAGSTFTQGCQGVLDASRALATPFTTAEQDALRASFADVGVFCDGATEPPPSCDDTFTTESGSVASPNYPSNYPNNYNHTWCIQPTSGQPATLTFDAFNTEAGFDFVTVRNAAGAIISNTAGTTAPAPATSTKFYVTFKSDGSVVATGFHANWSTGGTSNQPPTVSITSPTSGATISGTINVTASASDSDGSVARVDFTLPGGSTVSDTSAPYSVPFNTTTVANGAYTIQAVAVDNVGASSAPASIPVTVQNGGGGCIDGTFSATGLPLSIPDNNATGITSNLAVTGAGNIASLQLSLNISHTYRGDLVVTLISPTGTQFVVSNRSGGSADNIVISNQTVTNFNGQAAAGTWQLKVQDLARIDTGALNSWSLKIVGSCGGGGGWSGSASPNMATVDNGSACTNLTVSGGTGDASGVKLSISGTHSWRSILRGTLAHNGTTVAAFPTGTFASNSGTFSFTDRAVAGLSGDPNGTWTLCIIDTDAFGDTGVLNTWSVHN